MDQATVFTKTAKGITQVNQRSASLSKDLMKVLKLIDGKSNFGQIMEKAELDKNQLEKALNTLTKEGFARIFQVRKQEEVDPFGDGGGSGSGLADDAADDFDFTAPGKLATATQRVVPGAANDITELARQHEKQEADRKAKEAAHAAAAAKAKAQAQVRAKLEAEAKARQEAELQAMEQARRAKEAAERARAQVEAQLREEDARRKALAEQQAKLTAEQKAKEEAESRRLAELRAKAEREARALAEARARAEAEAAAMAKARAEAEAAAKRQATQASQAQAEMKARLKEEIEARIRGEMEQLLREQAEAKEDSEQARAEMRAQILAEAKMAAQAELEERLREERETIARAEAEARSKAEQEAMARADAESKKRAEAEARAAAETEARIRAEEEARRLRAQMEQASRVAAEAEARAKAEAERIKAEAERARADADARARLEAEARAREKAENEKRLAAERQAKVEAETRARVEAEEREKRERELAAQIEAERRAKQEAEKRAAIETRARENVEVETRARVQAEIEADIEKKAELEGKAQAKAYMEAKVRAEEEEERRIREEQERRAREIAEVLRTKVESHEASPSAEPRRRARREGNLAKTLLIGTAFLLILVIGALHVVPLRPYTAKVEKTLSDWLQDDVSIASMTFRLFPTPHLRVENMAVGKSLDARAAHGRIDLDLLTLLGEKPAIRAIVLDGVTLSPEAVRRIPIWGKPSGKDESGHIDRIELRAIQLDVRPAVEPFDARLEFDRDGTLREAKLNGSNWNATVKPNEGGLEFDASGRGMTLPVGRPISLSQVSGKGTYANGEIVVPALEAYAFDGKITGALKLSWPKDFRLQTELTIENADSGQLVAAFSRDIGITGKLGGTFNILGEGRTIATVMDQPRTQGRFRITEGSIGNIDLVAVMQSDTGGSRAGVTKFQELTGEVVSAEQRIAYRNLNLQGGVLRANGNLEVGANGSLAGRVNLEIRSQVASDRGTYGVAGTVTRPIMKRGG